MCRFLLIQASLLISPAPFHSHPSRADVKISAFSCDNCKIFLFLIVIVFCVHVGREPPKNENLNVRKLIHIQICCCCLYKIVVVWWKINCKNFGDVLRQKNNTKLVFCHRKSRKIEIKWRKLFLEHLCAFFGAFVLIIYFKSF